LVVVYIDISVVFASHISYEIITVYALCACACFSFVCFCPTTVVWWRGLAASASILQCESKKSPPRHCSFLAFFHTRFGIFN